jgi:hypothetical protein
MIHKGPWRAGLATDAGLRGSNDGRLFVDDAGDHKSLLATGILLDGANCEVEAMNLFGAADCATSTIAGTVPTIPSSNIHDDSRCAIWIGDRISSRLVGTPISKNGNSSITSRAVFKKHLPLKELK